MTDPEAFDGLDIGCCPGCGVDMTGEPAAAVRCGDCTPTLSEVMSLLDGLSAAAGRDDLASYQQALARAHELGCTREQIVDAYGYGRHRLAVGRQPGASFDVDGRRMGAVADGD